MKGDFCPPTSQFLAQHYNNVTLAFGKFRWEFDTPPPFWSKQLSILSWEWKSWMKVMNESHERMWPSPSKELLSHGLGPQLHPHGCRVARSHLATSRRSSGVWTWGHGHQQWDLATSRRPSEMWTWGRGHQQWDDIIFRETSKWGHASLGITRKSMIKP